VSLRNVLVLPFFEVIYCAHPAFLDLVLATETMKKKMTRDRITKKKRWKHLKTRANDNGDNGSFEPNPGEFTGPSFLYRLLKFIDVLFIVSDLRGVVWEGL
jgi:hypothetical protein